MENLRLMEKDNQLNVKIIFGVQFCELILASPDDDVQKAIDNFHLEWEKVSSLLEKE